MKILFVSFSDAERGALLPLNIASVSPFQVLLGQLAAYGIFLQVVYQVVTRVI